MIPSPTHAATETHRKTDGREYLIVAAGAALIAVVLAAGGGWLVLESGARWAGVLCVLWGLGFGFVAVRAAAVFVKERAPAEGRPIPVRV